MVGEVLHQGLEQPQHPLALLHRGGAKVNLLVIEQPEGGQGIGHIVVHADLAVGEGGPHRGADKGGQLQPAGVPATLADHVGQLIGPDQAGGDGIFEVVADVGDTVRPADHLALGAGRRGTRPRMVADSVEGLHAQVERGQDHVRSPHGVVVALAHEGIEGVF